MPKRIIRKLELFALHAQNRGRVDYDDIFAALARISRQQRVFKIRDYVIGLPIVRKVENFYLIRAAEGDNTSAPLVLDTATGDTRENILGDNEVLSEATHLLIAPNERRAAIEYVRRGAKAPLLGAAVEGLLRRRSPAYRELKFEFSPVISKDFVEEIGRFERIRQASIRVTRPNISWSEHYTAFSDLLEQSDGDKATIEVRAKRNGSLAENSGLVEAIKDVVKDEQPYLDDAVIIGTRTNEPNETTIHTKKHIVHTRSAVDADDAGVPNEASIRHRLTQFLSGFIQNRRR